MVLSFSVPAWTSCGSGDSRVVRFVRVVQVVRIVRVVGRAYRFGGFG